MTATPGAGVVNDYLILQYARFIFGLCLHATSRRAVSFAQHATTMFFAHLVGDACTKANANRSRRAYRTSPRSAGHLVALGSPFLETRAAQRIRGPDCSPIRVASEPAPRAFSYLSPEGPGSSAHRQRQFGNRPGS